MLYDPKWQTKEAWRTVLLKAADAIERHGHAKCALVDGGRMCIAGAINFVIFGKAKTLEQHPDKTAAMNRLDEMCDHCFVRFNNAPQTTAAEVVAKMRECARC